MKPLIAKELKPLVEPIDALKEFPGNPRRGNVEAIKASLTEFGQQAPIIVQSSTGYVVAGNHMLKAARDLGWTEMAVARQEMDDETARAYVIADNRTSDLGVYNPAALVKLLSDLSAVDALAGTGFTEDELSALMLAQPVPRETAERSESEMPTSLATVVLLLPDEEAEKFVRWCGALRKRYATETTAGTILRAVEAQAAL